MPHTLIIDGLQVPEVSDAAKAAIEKLQGQVTALTTARDAAVTERDEAKKAVETKDGEIAALNQKLKDAEVTPAKLQQLADARAKTIAAAQGVKPGIVVDGKTDAAIRKEAVEHALGDAAKDMADGAIDGAFAALTKDATPAGPAAQPITRPVVTDARAGASVRDAARTARYAN